MAWHEGTLTAAAIRSDHGIPSHVRYGMQVVPFSLPAGGVVHLNAMLQTV
jgi:hypothetical protein